MATEQEEDHLDLMRLLAIAVPNRDRPRRARPLLLRVPTASTASPVRDIHRLSPCHAPLNAFSLPTGRVFTILFSAGTKQYPDAAMTSIS